MRNRFRIFPLGGVWGGKPPPHFSIHLKKAKPKRSFPKPLRLISGFCLPEKEPWGLIFFKKGGDKMENEQLFALIANNPAFEDLREAAEATKKLAPGIAQDDAIRALRKKVAEKFVPETKPEVEQEPETPGAASAISMLEARELLRKKAGDDLAARMRARGCNVGTVDDFEAYMAFRNKNMERR